MLYIDFLDIWQQVVLILVFVSLAIGVLNYVIYKINYASKKSLKEKYDLASEKESKRLLTSHIFLAVTLFFFLNTVEYETIRIHPTWFFIRFFIALCGGVLYGYVAQLIIKFYYPKPLEKKLKALRYTPRVNPETGNTMKLLSEAEEDAYLDEGMQAEENVFSVDYDVWIDMETKQTKIEKYKGHLSALECDRCGFQTLRLQKEEVLSEATAEKDGELLKEYQCSYCNRIKRKHVALTFEIKDTAAIRDNFIAESEIKLVKLEFHKINGEVKEFDFQNADQAKQFLKEFTVEKLEEEEVY